MKKKLMVFVGVFLVLVFGSVAFLVLQDKSVEAAREKILEDSYGENGIEENGNLENDNENFADVSGNSGGGSSGGGGSESFETSESTTREIVCRNQTIKYSLKNFQEDIECLNNEGGKCTLLSAICSVDVYNIDVDVLGNFTIDYVLIDSFGEDIESQLIDMNVNPAKFVKFKANMTVEDSNGIDMSSSCTPRIISVPKKEVCS